MAVLMAHLYLRVKFRHKNLDETEMTAEGDKGPGVLLASGYIAGGALTGIVIAFMQGSPGRFGERMAVFSKSIEDWSTAHNPFFSGATLIRSRYSLYLCGRLSCWSAEQLAEDAQLAQARSELRRQPCHCGDYPVRERMPVLAMVSPRHRELLVSTGVLRRRTDTR